MWSMRCSLLLCLVTALIGVPAAVAGSTPARPLRGEGVLVGRPWRAEGNLRTAFFGASVASAGDVNGDGYEDVIVGAPGYDVNQTDQGRAFAYYGSATGLPATPDWTADGIGFKSSFGSSVGAAGDVNGDGYDDVIVGAYLFGHGEIYEGQASIYYGSASGLAATPAWTVQGNQSYAEFGAAVGTAGDVNGDGYDDAIVGAFVYDNGQTDEGRAFVYYGSATGPGTTADWTAESDQAGAWFGLDVGTAGDVNGDGYADVIIGSPLYRLDQDDEGRAVVYEGSASGLSSSPSWIVNGDRRNEWLGASVGTAGDVNGDGYADVIVGEPLGDTGRTGRGWALVYQGSPAGLSTSPDWKVRSDQANADFGWSVRTAGDENGDGFADVVVGASNYSGGQAYEGRVSVYEGSASGLSISAKWSAYGNQGGEAFGESVGTAGDVNGDGYRDVIVGAAWFTHSEWAEGAAFVYSGPLGSPLR